MKRKINFLKKIISFIPLYCAFLLAIFTIAVPISFLTPYLPWLNVILRNSEELQDVYNRCSNIYIGQSYQEILQSMNGLMVVDRINEGRFVQFYSSKYSGDVCFVYFSKSDPPIVIKSEFSTD